MSELPKPPDPVRPSGKPTGASSPNLRVMSAARKQAPGPEGTLVDRLKDNAEDQALNVFAVLRETWADFRSSDRFFKYKALIIGVWVVLISGTFVVSCPRTELVASNGLGARLVVAGDSSRPIYMVVNDSEKAWTQVTVRVNSEYEEAVEQVEPHGNVTVAPKLLVATNGGFAPKDLHIVTLEIRTAHGKTLLMKGGEIR